jgi:hypothetical protein
MTLEPAFSVAVVVIVGLAAFYLWYVLAIASIGDRVFAYPRDHWGPLWGCSFCAGFWLTGLLLLVTGTYDPLTHLACAGLCGVVGSLTS